MARSKSWKENETLGFTKNVKFWEHLLIFKELIAILHL